MRTVKVLKDFDVTTNPSARATQKVWRSYKSGTTAEVLESQYDQLLADGKIEDAPPTAEGGDNGEQKETARGRRKSA